MEMPDLTPDMLLRAYSIGVFPMAEDRDDPELVWVDPRMRGIIQCKNSMCLSDCDGQYAAGSLTSPLTGTFLASSKAAPRLRAAALGPGSTTASSDLYTSLHFKDHGHSVECWRDGNLVGGLYGISLRACFSAKVCSVAKRMPVRSRSCIWRRV